MGIGTQGEAYANFGAIGAPIYLMAYGLAIAWLISSYAKLSERIPLAVAMLPNTFLFALKAEGDFVTVSNFVTKGFLFHAAIAAGLAYAFRGGSHANSRNLDRS
ncbi:hypothetical protein Pla123a_11970 [Posidoniimonas polymericola]|uniref:Uncharacterized protein n=2 Tax=Posidoniimonas polymericola TaxID=2528002 RepID=A0A5C5YUE9_9BACT|nr:hypothetical protein Pla123a_11970 [Posidoniimonas polymericola]